MSARNSYSRIALACGTSLLIASCIFVAPLDELPPISELGGGGSSAMTEGSSGSGGSSGEGGASGGESGSAGADDGQCTTNAQCSRRLSDEPARCHLGRCVQLTSLDCPRAFGDSNNDNAVFFGAYTDINPAKPEESKALRIFQLGFDEINADGVDGLPPASALGERRPLVMIACDNAAGVEQSLQHLIDEVGVPAVLSTLETGDLISAVRNYIPKAFFLSAYGGSTALNGEPDQGMLWTMLGAPRDFAAIYAAVLGRVEHQLGTPEPLKVATVSTEDAFSTDLATFVPAALRYNGKSVEANSPDNYFAYSIDGAIHDADSQRLEQRLQSIAQDIYDNRVDVVISFADPIFSKFSRPNTNDDLAGLTQRIEALAAADVTAEDRTYYPTYILSPLNANQLELDVKLQIAALRGSLTDVLAYRRFVGIGAAAAEDRSLQAGFEERMRRKFGRDVDTQGNNLYDAFYFLVYAMVGAGSVPELQASNIANGMQRIVQPNRNEFKVGPEDIIDTFVALGTANTTISLVGTLGPPDFDPIIGTRIDFGSLSCFDAMGQVHFDAVRYDRTTERLVDVELGVCPP